MYTCTHCSVQSRRLENSGKLPKNCPMRFHPEVTDTPQPEYFLLESKGGLAGRRPLSQCAAPFCSPSFSTNSARI